MKFVWIWHFFKFWMLGQEWSASTRIAEPPLRQHQSVSYTLIHERSFLTEILVTIITTILAALVNAVWEALCRGCCQGWPYIRKSDSCVLHQIPSGWLQQAAQAQRCCTHARRAVRRTAPLFACASCSASRFQWPSMCSFSTSLVNLAHFLNPPGVPRSYHVYAGKSSSPQVASNEAPCLLKFCGALEISLANLFIYTESLCRSFPSSAPCCIWFSWCRGSKGYGNSAGLGGRLQIYAIVGVLRSSTWYLWRAETMLHVCMNMQPVHRLHGVQRTLSTVFALCKDSWRRVL